MTSSVTCTATGRIVFCLASMLSVNVVFAVDIPVRQLNEDETAAAHTITEGRVLTTVSFLASDAMAGRNTPSRELNIAAAYVAARFRGAGLEGLAADGTFYQNHMFELAHPPTNDATIRWVADNRIQKLPLLSGLSDAVQLEGAVLSESDALQTDDARIVLIDEPNLPAQAASNPSMVLATCARRIRELAGKGVKVVLMKCVSESPVIRAARSLEVSGTSLQGALVPECCIALVSDAEGLLGQNIDVQIEARRISKLPVRNVIGVLRGSHPERAKQAVLISAHLDHIGVRPDRIDEINNGADDNATGVTAVLSLADAFAVLQQRPQHSIVFATFWGEEKGLLGSKQFVSDPLWPLPSIVANINIEMVGRPEPDAREKAWMTGWKHSNLGDIMNAGSKRLGVEIFNRTDVGEMLYSRSDNFPFAQRGVVAHSFSAGSLHADYHQPSDEWQKLDIPHMTTVIRGLFAGSLVVADGAVTVKPAD